MKQFVIMIFLSGMFCMPASYSSIAEMYAPRTKKINVKKNGAVGDGRHDDTHAIEDAIERADTIIVPKGTYKVTRKMDFKNVRDKVIIATGAIITNQNNDVGTIQFDKGSNLSVIGGTWTRMTRPRQEGKGPEHTFTCIGIKNLKIENVTIDGSPEMGIAMLGVVGGSITGNTIKNCFRDGIYSHYSAKLLIEKNYLENIKDDAISIHDYGVVSQKSEILSAGFAQAGHSIIRNNFAKNTYQGLASIGCDNLMISGNKFYNTVGAGIAIENSETMFKGGTATAKNITIKENTLNNNCGTQQIIGKSYTNGGQFITGRSALFVAVLDSNVRRDHPTTRLVNITIINNRISNCFTNGACIEQVDNLIFSNNIFSNCNIDNSIYCGSIIEIGNSNNVYLADNRVTDNRKHPKHKVGYQITNVKGKMKNWVVKGYSEKMYYKNGISPETVK